MFQKRTSPFACIITAVVTGLLCCTVTFVAVGSAFSVAYIKKHNELREKTKEYSDYISLIESVNDNSDYHTKLSQMIDLIENAYIYDYDEQELWNNVYRSVAVSIGDKYSQYLTVEEYNSLLDDNDGEFVGIGVHAARDVDTNGIYIFGVMPSSPAERGGVLKGDVIIAVEGVEATEDNYYDLLDLVRGESGSQVTVTVIRGGQRLDITLERAPVASENVIYEKLDNNVAYVKILSFSDDTVSEQFSEIITLAKNEGCESFIFDVRRNTGGYLTEICDVLDLLLPEGVIINIVDKNGNTSTRNSDAEFVEIENMVVLCDEGTASAAELFAAALRDYELADLVGETTFGKGSMQTTYTLKDGSSFKFSMALYNPPSNVSYDGVGITPDHVVPLGEEWEERFFKMPLSEDVQFQKALELVTSTN